MLHIRDLLCIFNFESLYFPFRINTPSELLETSDMSSFPLSGFYIKKFLVMVLTGFLIIFILIFLLVFSLSLHQFLYCSVFREYGQRNFLMKRKIYFRGTLNLLYFNRLNKMIHILGFQY